MFFWLCFQGDSTPRSLGVIRDCSGGLKSSIDFDLSQSNRLYLIKQSHSLNQTKFKLQTPNPKPPNAGVLPLRDRGRLRGAAVRGDAPRRRRAPDRRGEALWPQPERSVDGYPSSGLKLSTRIVPRVVLTPRTILVGKEFRFKRLSGNEVYRTNALI